MVTGLDQIHLKKQQAKVRINRSYNPLSAVSVILICVIDKFDIHFKNQNKSVCSLSSEFSSKLFSIWYSSGTGAEVFHLLSAPGTVKCNPSLAFRMSKHLTHPYKEQWPGEEGRRIAYVIAWFLGMYSSSKKYRFTSSVCLGVRKCSTPHLCNSASLLYLIQILEYIASSFIPYTKICFLSLDNILIAYVFSGTNNSELLTMEEFGCCVSSLPVLKKWDSTQNQRFAV